MVKSFASFQNELIKLIDPIVANPILHGRWINTLSYLENCGARLIAACEHPTLVKEEMLKHAAEEFRHAFYLKSQLNRVGACYEDYSRGALLGAWPGYHYLNRLNLETSRSLRSLQTPLKPLAYLLVTYAIELRASELYPIYQSILKQRGSKVQVQSILLEEKEHLREMEEALQKIPSAPSHIETVCAIEASLFKQWLAACSLEIKVSYV